MNLEFRKSQFDNANQSSRKTNSFSVQSDSAQAEKTPDNPLEFALGEFVVYPAHGVGQILAIEVQTIAGACLEFFVIYFVKRKMSLRVPTQKASRVGMRKLSSSATIERARLVLSETSRRARTNWSQLARAFEAKIKSGDIIAVAEATRDLCRRSANSEQSYSERQLYTAALDRLAGEVSMVEGISEEKTVSQLEGLLLSRIR
ncbi:CarD family transcriptional regulator [Bradyrhizobium sp.]|jgi:CarD family transcriptional regulator|uniref:CarD family transcriptional regulator n=1 Tax=Bradyrhizobium sp. TaxID=376 RepID=UPI003C1DA167